MEQRKQRVTFAKPGGNASKGAVTPRITLPNVWMKEMDVTPEQREVIMTFDGEQITIHKGAEAEEE